MRKNLTNTVVAGLKGEEKPYEVRDTIQPGLLLRVQPSGLKTYYVEYMRGKRTRIGPATSFSPAAARDAAKAIQGEGCMAKLGLGEDPVQRRKKEKAETYDQFLTEVYEPWLLQRKEDPRETINTLRRTFKDLLPVRLSEITPGMIEKWKVDRLQDGLRPSSLNRQLNDLRACLNRAKDLWQLIDKNPIEGVKPEKTDSLPKVRYLTEDEEVRLRRALDDREEEIRAGRDSGNQWRIKRGYEAYSDLKTQYFADHVKPAVLLSMNTGLRRGELLKLKWSNIDTTRASLTVDAVTAKDGETRHIPLNDEALTVLKQWKEQPGVKGIYVFANRDGEPMNDMRTSWEKVLEKAEITDFRWHDLRHHFASKLVMAGVDLNTVRELLGHSDYKMTLRYAHLAPEHKAAAVAKLAPPKAAI